MNHRPRKRFGQHFLHDPGIIRRIVAAVAPRPGERLAEIGPGQGALTAPLLEACGELDVVELDRDLAAALPQRLAGRGHLRVHAADALRFDFRALGPSLRVVGNLPYNISTPLLFHLLEQADHIRDMHFMLQREVVARMAAPPGARARGRLSVMIQYHCEVAQLFDIGPGAFRPPPRVESAFVRLVPRARPPVDAGDPGRFACLVRQAFSQPRKTLRNNLRGLLDEQALADAGVDPRARPATLTLDAFAALARRLPGPPPQSGLQ